LIEKIKILRWEGYTETYFFYLEDLWEIRDSPLANYGPSVWKFTKLSAGKHDSIM